MAVAGSRALEHTVVQRLAWRLEGPRVDLMVAPNVGDVAGPRVTMRMAADLPLLHLDEPHLTGPKRAIKRTLDIVFGILLFVLFLPFMIIAGDRHVRHQPADRCSTANSAWVAAAR